MEKTKETQKRFIIMASMYIFFISFVSANACPDDNNILLDNLPCEVITPSEMNCSSNATILGLSNTTIEDSVAMQLKIPSKQIYNFSFNYSQEGFYFVILCDNSTATYYVHEDDKIIVNSAPVGIGTGFDLSDLPDFGDGELTLSDIEDFVKDLWQIIKEASKKYYWIVIPLVVFISMGVVKKKEKKKS